jgi:hypothetical protein
VRVDAAARMKRALGRLSVCAKVVVCCILAVRTANALQPRVVQVPDRCGQCGVEPVVVQRLDGEANPDFIDAFSPLVVRDSRKRVIAAPSPLRPPTVFDSSGKTIRDLARLGQGPGEIPGTLWIERFPDDVIAVYSRDRVTVFDASLRAIDGQAAVRRAVFGSMPTSVAWLSDGRYAVTFAALEPRTPSSWAMPVHIRDSANRTVTWLDLGETVANTKGVLIASASDARTFWGFGRLADGKGYVVSLFRDDGTELVRIERRAGWWVPTAGTSPFSAPALVRETSDGRLLVLVRHPDPQSRGLPQPQRSDPAAHAATMIDVIAAESGRLLANRLVPGAPSAILDDQHVAIRSDREGFPVLMVLRLSDSSLGTNERRR